MREPVDWIDVPFRYSVGKHSAFVLRFSLGAGLAGRESGEFCGRSDPSEEVSQCSSPLPFSSPFSRSRRLISRTTLLVSAQVRSAGCGVDPLIGLEEESRADLLLPQQIHEPLAPPTPPYVPPEVVERILCHLNPKERIPPLRTLLACTLVSSIFRAIALSNFVWLPLLDARWSYSNPAPPNPSAAENYRARVERDDLAVKFLRELIVAPNRRLAMVSKLAALSYDVVDALTSFEHVSEEMEPEDWLNLRHWAVAVPGVIRRTAVVDT